MMDQIVIGNDALDDMMVARTEYLEDEQHLKPCVFHEVQRKEVRARQGELTKVVRPGKLDSMCLFNQALREAYNRDYKYPGLTYFGTHPIRWSKKVSFLPDHAYRRECFFVGDCIELQNGKLARVDAVFTHTVTTTHRIFLTNTYLLSENDGLSRDPVLDVPVHQVTDSRDIVGLPSLRPTRLWMVETSDKLVLNVPFDIYTK